MTEAVGKEIAIEGVDPRELYGPRNVYLDQIKALHPQLRIVARGSSLKVLGSEAETQRFGRHMEGLVAYYLKYGHISSEVIGQAFAGGIAGQEAPALGENQIQLDCDVLQADGGTRTASVTGAYVALVDAVNWAEKHRHIKSASRVLKDYVSAVSVGVINGTPMLDLPYIEDSQAMTDMNVAMTGSGTFIEIQGTAEHRPFNRAELGTLLDLAEKGNKELQAAQRAALSLD